MRLIPKRGLFSSHGNSAQSLQQQAYTSEGQSKVRGPRSGTAPPRPCQRARFVCPSLCACACPCACGVAQIRAADAQDELASMYNRERPPKTLITSSARPTKVGHTASATSEAEGNRESPLVPAPTAFGYLCVVLWLLCVTFWSHATSSCAELFSPPMLFCLWGPSLYPFLCRLCTNSLQSCWLPFQGPSFTSGAPIKSSRCAQGLTRMFPAGFCFHNSRQCVAVWSRACCAQ